MIPGNGIASCKKNDMDKKNQRDRDGRYTTKIDEKQNFALKHRKRKKQANKNFVFCHRFQWAKAHFIQGFECDVPRISNSAFLVKFLYKVPCICSIFNAYIETCKKLLSKSHLIHIQRCRVRNLTKSAEIKANSFCLIL